MLPFHTLSVHVARPWAEVYEALWRPEAFPRWAAGLSQSQLHKEGDEWLANGPEGPVRIRFTEHNRYGVMDHYVDTGRGSEVYVPLRVIANGSGAEVLLTLFRQPGMSDEKFRQDGELVKRDLQALKSLLNG